jgi:drug/metabolite transporter (DMT)-like permease
MTPLSPAHARLCVILAALLWSSSGAFTKVLTKPTPLAANEPPLEPWHFAGIDFPVQIACYRVLFACIALAPLVSRREIRFRPMLFVMGVCFALMNILFISANALGTAANAILLQYSAPLWIYLVSVTCMGERADLRGTVSLFAGVAGVGVIVAGGWKEGDLIIVLIALGSGLMYAGVVLCLRVLRDESSRWLTVWNHGVAGLVLVPLLIGLRPPTVLQLVVLVLFGVVQMGLAYWLMARALRSLGAAEAGTLSLLEPLLNPLWTYLVSGERPSDATFLGGAIILAALAWRYAPGLVRPRPLAEPSPQPEDEAIRNNATRSDR